MIPVETKLDTITQEILKYRLNYNPDTGEFRWLVTRFNINIGKLAGCQDLDLSRGIWYLKIRLHGKLYKAHRLAYLYMIGSFPLNEIDHGDGDGLNNKWDNLRAVTTEVNSKNKRLYDNNTSGVTGITYRKRTNRWLVQISIKGIQTYIGSFTNKEDAIEARLAKERELGYHTNHGRR